MTEEQMVEACSRSHWTCDACAAQALQEGCADMPVATPGQASGPDGPGAAAGGLDS
jgi:hypothetical protein